MVHNYLTKNPSQILRVTCELEKGQIELKFITIDVINYAVANGNDHQGYYLPWCADEGYYIDLPIAVDTRNLFFTSELTGCCVGVQKINDTTIRVRHYNIQGKEVFDNEDFVRYDHDDSRTFWLLPDQKYQNKENLRIPYQCYSGYTPGFCMNPTLFWGEKLEDKWTFYYQTPDGTIHNFSYR